MAKKMLFKAQTQTHGNELWITDGTEQGTQLVKDIQSGELSSDPNRFLSLGNGKVLFSATDIGSNEELWITDGTSDGTRVVKELSTSDGSYPIPLVSLGNGKAIFQAYTPDQSLWVTDGTESGTQLLGNFGTTPYSYNKEIVSLDNGRAIFKAAKSNDSLGDELWITDGTPNGTQLLKDINVGIDGSALQYMVKLGNNKVLFNASDNQHGSELWITDGTEQGTKLVKDIDNTSDSYSNPNSSSPYNFFNMGNGKVLFTARDSQHGEELWITDGTEQGTSLVKEINTAQYYDSWEDIYIPLNSFASNFFSMGNGKVVFTAYDSQHGEELWITDGTEQGTSLVKDIDDTSYFDDWAQVYRPNSSGPRNFFGTGNGKVLFSAYESQHGNELWITDGTEQGTTLVKDINSGHVIYDWDPSSTSWPYSSNVKIVSNLNGTLIFSANDGNGMNLWTTDGTEAGTHSVLPNGTYQDVANLYIVFDEIIKGVTSAPESVTGTSGDDIIAGGAGKDALTGGAGNDLFVYDAKTDSTVKLFDTIKDFDSAGNDIIDFSAVAGITKIQGFMKFASIKVQPHSVAWTVDKSGNTQVYANTSNAPELQTKADMKIILTGHPTLDASDFVLAT